ncbi:MAG: coproporphyrinogen dehydrogenase HemZ, partial [Oscillospiraceae bacterium]|nr:coproporphyrinogen dehydrogenase HemZ [Oscillospiraceae bacterium]
MTFYHVGHGFDFELRNIARLFFPRGGEAVAIETRREAAGDGGTAGCDNAAGRNGTVTLSCRLRAPGFDRTLDAPGGGDEELTLCTLLYRLCVEYTGCTMDWGVLTGVRPIKLLRRLTEAQGRGDAAAYFRDKLLVSEGKLTLALDTMDNEDAQLRRSAPTSCSVYVAIPFCPTRCAYCSFVSQTVEQAGRLMAPYVEALEQEIEATGALISALGLQVETVYIGGGTPTALPAPLLRRVCDAVGRHLPPPVMREYTVEA